MKIRRAKFNDAPGLGALSNQLGYPTSNLQSADRLRLLLNSRENMVFVCYIPENKLIGWIHVFLAHRLESDSFAEIGGFVVHEAYRGLGAGKKLLAEAEKWALNQEMSNLRIRSRTTKCRESGQIMSTNFVAVSPGTYRFKGAII